MATIWSILVLASGMAFLPSVSSAQSRGPDSLVVYCLDEARHMVTRSLAADCHGKVVSEKEADAARAASAERRRRILEPKADAAEPVEATPLLSEPSRPEPRPAAERGAEPAAPLHQEAPKTEPASREPAPPTSEKKNTETANAHDAPPPQQALDAAGIAAKNLGAVKAIVDKMRPGEWREIPNTRMETVFPKQAGHPAWGVQGPVAVTLAWGGAAFDTKRDILIITGGGHGDYGGNEVYQFSLATLQWTRATDPSPLRPRPGGADGQFEVADGTEAPVSSHTYDGLLYLPNVDRMFKFGGSYYRIGHDYDDHAYLYDDQAKRWERRARAPRAVIEVSSGYDAATGEALVVTTNGLMAYNPVADKWRDVAIGDNQDFGRVADFDPVNRRLVQLGSRKAPIVFYDVDSAGRRRIADATGDLDFAKGGPMPGIAYHPASRRFAIWKGGREVWAVDARSWKSTLFKNPNGSAPRHEGHVYGHKTAGIYGRWAYVPDLDVFLAYGHSSDDVWLYKLPRVGFVEAAAHDECGGADLCVGPGFRFPAPSDAARVAKPGQTVAIAAGDYVDCATWPVSVTIRGYRGRPHIHDKTCGGKAVWIVQGDETLIENVELSGGSSSDGNGNAIRFEGKHLIVRGCSIHHNQMGILTGHRPDAVLEVYDCEFHHQRSNAALAHNIYAGKIDRFVAIGNYIHDADSGHHIKSVAHHNKIVANLLVDTVGTEAAMIDVWGCATSLIAGNIMSKAGVTGNLNFISLTKRIEYGKEIPCPSTAGLSASLIYNTAVFTNPDKLYAAFVYNNFGVPYTAANNIIVNTREVEFYAGVRGKGELIANTHLEKPAPDLFVDAKALDFRLRKPIAAKDVRDKPEWQYKHPASVVRRTSASTAGAIEAVH